MFPFGSGRRKRLDAAALDKAGLNLQAVFDIDALPESIRAEIHNRYDPTRLYRQLILIGHGGRAMWDAVQAASVPSLHPIDDFSKRAAEQWFLDQCPGKAHEIIFPGNDRIGLQALGRLAGWHHDSPLRVGINDRWGTWYAYRVVMLADSDFEPTPPAETSSPCETCDNGPCIATCPASAVSRDNYALDLCVSYRKQPNSPCATRCIARIACPAGVEHRYKDEQIQHTYSISLETIRKYY